MQLVVFASALKNPLMQKQSNTDAAPSLLLEFAAQISHSLAFSKPLALLYRPLGHSNRWPELQ